jgi:dTDP-glucose 4,6-dehydratase
VNVGNPHEITVLQLAKEILGLTGSKSRIVFVPRPEDDPGRRRPDITKARKLLGWEPKVERTEGLRKTIEYFRTLG